MVAVSGKSWGSDWRCSARRTRWLLPWRRRRARSGSGQRDSGAAVEIGAHRLVVAAGDVGGAWLQRRLAGHRRRGLGPEESTAVGRQRQGQRRARRRQRRGAVGREASGSDDAVLDGRFGCAANRPGQRRLRGAARRGHQRGRRDPRARRRLGRIEAHRDHACGFDRDGDGPKSGRHPLNATVATAITAATATTATTALARSARRRALKTARSRPAPPRSAARSGSRAASSRRYRRISSGLR